MNSMSPAAMRMRGDMGCPSSRVAYPKRDS